MTKVNQPLEIIKDALEANSRLDMFLQHSIRLFKLSYLTVVVSSFLPEWRKV